MTLKFSTDLRDAKAAQYEAEFGATAVFDVRSGSPPVNCAAGDMGTLLARINLPAAPLTDPSGGMVERDGEWSDVGIANGDAGHFRIKVSAGGACVMQGTITEAGGGGDAIIAEATVTIDEPVTVLQFRLTEAGA